MKTKNEFVNDLQRFLGLFILALLGISAVSAILYGLLGYFDGQAHRLIAVALLMLLPVAYWLGRRESRAHRDGVERGIGLKVAAQTRPAPQPTRPLPPAWQDVLPATVDIQIKQPDSDVVIL